jgi:hypothetical protein
MNNEKKTFEAAEIEIVSFARDLLITSAGTLGENDWASFNFSQF